MPETLLRTKLFVPPLRPSLVGRPHLIERLNQGLEVGRALTLVSAPAGFGKTTLVSEWVASCERPVVWLSLDEGDNDPGRFLTYLVAALQTIEEGDLSAGNIGEGVLAMLQSPQLPPVESMLAVLLNEITHVTDHFILVLDDYHSIDSKMVDSALNFMLEHLPPQMHLVIATREDPQLPLARLRARNQLTELRVADLRFTPAEAAEFFGRVMGLGLRDEEIAALEARTEGWVAGLQLAALALQGQDSIQRHKDATRFIKAFTGSHHFVLDYLVEEVLHQQSEEVQIFLLRTSILDRLCGSLCDALLQKGTSQPAIPSASGQETLEYLAQANLFIVPLDDERRWYRYHHLFADLLRQRLQQIAAPAQGGDGIDVAVLHGRASQWYEDNGLELEAFQHAAAARDVERAERLMKGDGMPLHFRGAMTPVLNWLSSLPSSVLDTRPSLWVTYASVSTMLGQPISSVEEKLSAAETALQDAVRDDNTRDLVGHIAAIRAMLAIPKSQPDTIIAESRKALEHLNPSNLPVRTTAAWTLGFAYQLQGDRAAASRAYTEAIAASQASGNVMITIAAMTCLGQVQEAENQLHLAAQSYQRVLQLAGDPPWPAACEACLGLARVHYEWNELDAAQQYGKQSLQLARQMETVDTPAASELLLSRVKLGQGDADGAAALLAQAEQFVRQRNFLHRMPEVVATHVRILLSQGDLVAAAHLADKHALPMSQARVRLAQGDPSSALSLLAPWRRQAEAKGWQDELLRVRLLHALACQAQRQEGEAVQLLDEALALAETGGFIRIFLDEGPPMEALLRVAAKHGIAPSYLRRILAAFGKPLGSVSVAKPLIEPLSEREIEVLRLLATDLSGPDIARELMVSPNTMRTHTKNIYSKLGVHNRRTAVQRGEELDLL